MLLADKAKLKEPLQLRSEVLDWLESLRVKDARYGTYKMSTSTEATLFSSCFAAFLRELYGDLRNVTPEQKREWISLINSCQDAETGFFVDSRLKHEQTFSANLTKRWDWGYVTWQSTTFCISALKALGGHMEYPLKFLEEWKNADRVRLWLKNLDWRWRTWAAGNVAMFLGICLITDYEMNNDPRARDTLEAFFAWHDSFCDPKTGFWGTDHGTPIHVGLFGAMHQFLLYYYVCRPLRHMERIVDNALLIQQPDGLFSPVGGGGACEDLDAVDTLVNMFHRIDYRRDDIRKALCKTFVAIINLQNDDGGFPWAKRYHYGIKDWSRLALSIGRTRNFNYWLYSCGEAILGQTVQWKKPDSAPGWTEIPVPVSESYIFATWFRSLCLALISQVIPESPYAQIEWRFLSSPGLGYFSRRNPRF